MNSPKEIFEEKNSGNNKSHSYPKVDLNTYIFCYNQNIFQQLVRFSVTRQLDYNYFSNFGH